MWPPQTCRYYANQSSTGNQQTRPIRCALLPKVWHCWHPLVGGPPGHKPLCVNLDSVDDRPDSPSSCWRRETGEIADNGAHHGLSGRITSEDNHGSARGARNKLFFRSLGRYRGPYGFVFSKEKPILYSEKPILAPLSKKLEILCISKLIFFMKINC